MYTTGNGQFVFSIKITFACIGKKKVAENLSSHNIPVCIL
jgi:hypothetical protein